jgi:hypothetical protein
MPAGCGFVSRRSASVDLRTLRSETIARQSIDSQGKKNTGALTCIVLTTLAIQTQQSTRSRNFLKELSALLFETDGRDL